MASDSTQVEAEVNKQEEETIKDLPVSEEKVATVTDEDEKAVMQKEEAKLSGDEVESEIKEENDSSPTNIDDEEAEPGHAAALNEEVEVEDEDEEFDQPED